MKSRRLLKLVLFSGIISLSGCSSVMSHTGGKEGTYPGTRSSAQTLGDSDTNWGVKSLVALDMPFTRRHGYPAAAVGYVPHRQLHQISGRKEREGYAGDQLGDPASADACPVSYRPVCVSHS
ncbi:outer membrane lipoprotein YidQ [Klebsiella pneumoniae]|nr:outer membrane lipoprotein YidQ [Klebsiella pneumoniae]